MLFQFAYVIAGLVLLLWSGDLLVRGVVGLATALKIPALLISLTVVAFGTSAPELIVSVQAVLAGSEGIAIGNIIGSNIANIFLVLGVPALIYPIKTNVIGLRRHGVVMLVASAAFAGAAYVHGAIDTIVGIALILGVVLYVTYLWIHALRSPDADPMLEEVEEHEPDKKVSLKTIGLIFAGLIGMPVGAHLLVSNGSIIASGLGVRDEVIGLTIIAFGTSLPELATVVAAAIRKNSDVAIGSIIGSCTFNIFVVGGAVGLVGTAYFDSAALRLDIPVMLLGAVTLSLYVFTRKTIGKVSGLLMTAVYVGYIYMLAISI
ncbi:MAG: calcium/sodium antiporter [Emcibacter sp.]|nr:calcium/sodium antiporter [Emcibacter sp.]